MELHEGCGLEVDRVSSFIALRVWSSRPWAERGDMSEASVGVGAGGVKKGGRQCGIHRRSCGEVVYRSLDLMMLGRVKCAEKTMSHYATKSQSRRRISA